MNFEEDDIAITIPDFGKTFIYFLLLENKVVYVGQTRCGLYRPLSHRDKMFDTIKIIPCSERDLEILENKYILKYRPIHNKNISIILNISLQNAKNKINSIFDTKYNIRQLKNILDTLGINPLLFSNKPYITHDDFISIIKYLEDIYGRE
jgi:hypothetical protein